MDDTILQIRLHKRQGVEILSSGTTGDPKTVWRSPENLKACNEVAIDVQKITPDSKIYTCTKMDHAGGLLLQTLPAYTLGCDIEISTFNPFTFLKDFQNYTHTFLPPKMCQAVMKTKGFATCGLNGKTIAMGSDPISYAEIKAFVSKGATVIANWGMSEVGPNAINTTFWSMDKVEEFESRSIEGTTLLGDMAYCSVDIRDNELWVKGNISIHGDKWFATNDMVTVNNNGEFYYLGRRAI